MKNQDGRLVKFEDIVKNREVYVPKLAEGNVPLEKLLNQSIDQNIPTIACCAGHLEKYKTPYITFEYNNNTRKKLNAVIENATQINGTSIMFSTTGISSNPFNVTIRPNRLNRDKVFDVMNATMELEQQKEVLDDSVDTALRIALNLDYRQETAHVTIYDRSLFGKYGIGIYGQQYKEGILNVNKSSGGKSDSLGKTIYYYKTVGQMHRVSKEFADLGLQYTTSFDIDLHASTNELIDRMTDYNEAIIKETGGISRRPR